MKIKCDTTRQGLPWFFTIDKDRTVTSGWEPWVLRLWVYVNGHTKLKEYKNKMPRIP